LPTTSSGGGVDSSASSSSSRANPGPRGAVLRVGLSEPVGVGLAADYAEPAEWERIGGNTGADTPSGLYRRLRTAMLAAEREEFVRLRDQGELDDEVLRAVVRDLDLEEALLSRYDTTM
jgi:hypothetical protein